MNFYSDSGTLERHLVHHTASILSALRQLNSLRADDSMTLFVVDDDRRLQGALTDGDIRRRILHSADLSECAGLAMNANARFLRLSEFSLPQIVSLRDEVGIEILPVTESDTSIVDILDLRRLRSVVPVHAVLMAGGEGQRLRPLTANCPKPMLEVSGLPIIRHTVERLKLYGVRRITICVRYLAEQITEYFGDGQRFGLTIDYLNEREPLGTLGGACQLKYDHQTVLVMNADLITNIDFEDFYLFHTRTRSDATVASFQRKISIPFAVLGVDEFSVNTIQEKPDYEFWCNAGIYLFSTSALSRFESVRPLLATDAMSMMRAAGDRVSMYPMYAYWKDLGTVADLTQARLDFPYIRF